MNIGPNLTKSIPASDKSDCSFLDGSFINSFFLESASEQEVTEICSSFRSGTAPGYDCISIKVVQGTFNLICAPLTYIINLSLNSGVVPQEMKIARVIPLLNLVISLCSIIRDPYQCYQVSLNSWKEASTIAFLIF